MQQEVPEKPANESLNIKIIAFFNSPLVLVNVSQSLRRFKNWANSKIICSASIRSQTRGIAILAPLFSHHCRWIHKTSVPSLGRDYPDAMFTISTLFPALSKRLHAISFPALGRATCRHFSRPSLMLQLYMYALLPRIAGASMLKHRAGNKYWSNSHKRLRKMGEKKETIITSRTGKSCPRASNKGIKTNRIKPIWADGLVTWHNKKTSKTSRFHIVKGVYCSTLVTITGMLVSLMDVAYHRAKILRCDGRIRARQVMAGKPKDCDGRTDRRWETTSETDVAPI